MLRSSLLLFLSLFPAVSFAQFEEFTVDQLRALWEKPDDRTRMLPGLKAIYPNATSYTARVTINVPDAEPFHPPKEQVKEKWVDGKWVVSWMEFATMPKDLFKDRTMIMAVTYDGKTETFHKLIKPPVRTEGNFLVVHHTGKKIDGKRGIRWFQKVGKEPLSEEIHTDTTTRWTEWIREGGKVVRTIEGVATSDTR